MLERKVSMLLDYLGGAGSEPERRVAAYVRKAAAERARQIATPPKTESREADAAAGAEAADGRARRLIHR